MESLQILVRTDGDVLSLNVDEYSNLIDFELVLSVAPIFGLTEKQANEQLKEIKSVIENNWRELAKKYGTDDSGRFVNGILWHRHLIWNLNESFSSCTDVRRKSERSTWTFIKIEKAGRKQAENS